MEERTHTLTFDTYVYIPTQLKHSWASSNIFTTTVLTNLSTHMLPCPQGKVWYHPQVRTPRNGVAAGGQVRETPLQEEGRDQKRGGRLSQGVRSLSLPDGVPQRIRERQKPHHSH